MYCPGKSADQVVAILGRLAESHVNVLATRATPEVHALATQAGLRIAWYPAARILVANPEASEGVGLIVVVSAGTSDLAIAEEAAVTAEVRGNRVERVYDAGVAGLHRSWPSIRCSSRPTPSWSSPGWRARSRAWSEGWSTGP